jgi:hypothetical protein
VINLISNETEDKNSDEGNADKNMDVEKNFEDDKSSNEV